MSHNKYGARKTVIDGHTFDSKAEADRYVTLKLCQTHGLISGLELQPKFPLKVNGKLVCTYIADFEYLEKGIRVIEDVKGVKTRDYRIKRKLFEALHAPLVITEITKGKK